MEIGRQVRGRTGRLARLAVVAALALPLAYLSVRPPDAVAGSGPLPPTSGPASHGHLAALGRQQSIPGRHVQAHGRPNFKGLTAGAGFMAHTGSPLNSGAQPPAASAQSARPTGRVSVMLELIDQPTVRAFATARLHADVAQAQAAGRAQLSTVEAAQRALLVPLAALHAQVLYRVQRVYNGIAVLVDASQLAQLQSLPGVKAVHLLVPKYATTSTSVPFIGAPQLWYSGGITTTGQGIKIGIIDSGVDYIHTDFGGSGLAADYQRNDTTTITDGDNFPGPRVVSGTDLVGDSYDATPTDPTYQPVPHPDPDPAPCYPPPYGPGGGNADHGTHVAGIAAGSGVNADGTTNSGPYSATLPFSSFAIGPGVAPQAQIYAIRVFGCNGGTNMVAAALDYAVDPNGDGDTSDHLDVVNMSLGSDYGPADDPDAVATDNAVLAGVIVAAAAGNAGDNYYVTGSPGSASRDLSVASSLDNGLSNPVLQVNSPLSETLQAAPAEFGPPLTATGLTGTFVYTASSDGLTDACAPYSPQAAAAITGNIALIDRGNCFFDAKVANAQAAGARGAVIVDNVPGAPIPMGSSGTLTTTVTIPSLMIAQSDGATLEADLPTPGVNATLLAAPAPQEADTLSSFSSRGPRGLDSFLKPDITAPGDQITSAANGTGTGSLVLSGTSMASPHLAGTMALLRQIHPTWTIEELKALVMNTATHDLRSATPLTATIYGPGRVGAGRVDVAQAGADQVIAYTGDGSGLVSLSFGTPEVVTTFAATKNLTVSNKGTTSVAYTVAYSGVTTVPGVTYTVPSTVALGPGATTTLPVTLTAIGSLMQHTIDPTAATTQAGLPRPWISEAAGYVVLTPVGGGQALRVPVYAVPRAASAMSATQNTLDVGNAPSATTSITLTGQGVAIGNLAAPNPAAGDEVSLVTPFELAQTSPGVSTGLTATADLTYIGVTSNVGATTGVSDTNTEVYFGLATQAPWATNYPVGLDVYIDTNRDGIDDYVLINGAVLQGTSPTDVFVSELCDLHNPAAPCLIEDFLNGYDAGTLDTVPFNTDVLVLPVFTADLGLTPGNSQFNYRVQTFSPLGTPTDVSNELTYDAANPGLDFSGGFTGIPTWFDEPGGTIPVVYNQAAYTANGSQGVLLLHTHNAMGSHVEVLGVAAALPTDTPTPSPTPTAATGTPLPTATGTPPTPASTATITSVPPPTATAPAAATSAPPPPVVPPPPPPAATSTPLPSATPTGTATSTPPPAGTPTATPAATNTTAPPGTATLVPTNTPIVVPGGINTAQPAATAPPAATATEAPTATATATPVSPVGVHNAPRTVKGGRGKPCALAQNLARLTQGCEIISSVSAPGATVLYTITYPGPHGPRQTFEDHADARGHSLHIFNVPYLPPAGAGHGAAATIARVTVAATLPDGTPLDPGGTRFVVVR